MIPRGQQPPPPSRLRLRLFAGLGLLLLGACAFPTPQSVGRIDAAGIEPVPASVELRAGHALDASEQSSVVRAFLDDDAALLRESIALAVEENGLFSAVVEPGGGAQYVVEARLVALTHAGADLVFSVKGFSAIEWRCVEQPSGRVVFDEKIRAEVVKTVGDAFAGGTRIIRACEGAVGANIEQGLTAISAALHGAP